MFPVNSACKSFIFTSLSSLRFNKLIGLHYSSSYERIYTPVNKSKYVRYQFPERTSDNYAVDIKQQKFDSSFSVIPDIVSTDQEEQLIEEIETSLKRLRYQQSHWDDAIHGYRETEITIWKNPNNARLIQNIRNKIFTNDSTTKPMTNVHVLDLSDNGFVKPHVDSVRFCGNIIAGLSLLSDSVMRLADETHPDIYVVYALLPRRSLYIMKNDVRYQYTHEILNDIPSIFNDKQFVRKRRVSIVMRNEPSINTAK